MTCASPTTPADDDDPRVLHRTIAAVRDDMAAMSFNTAIARLIELNNHLTQVVAADGGAHREVVEPLVLMVAPLAPHIAEELWARLGHTDTLTYEAFPTADPAWLVDDDGRGPGAGQRQGAGADHGPAGADAAAHEAPRARRTRRSPSCSTARPSARSSSSPAASSTSSYRRARPAATDTLSSAKAMGLAETEPRC